MGLAIDLGINIPNVEISLLQTECEVRVVEHNSSSA